MLLRNIPIVLEYPSFGFFSLAIFNLNNFEVSIGVSEIAVIVEVVTVIVTIHPSCLNSTPVNPGTKVNGKNTATITRVVTITASHTSFVAYMAASLGLLPRSICLDMFSNTTIASSTTIPIAMVRDAREITLMEFPVKNRYMNDVIREMGMANAIMNVALHLPRKNKTTNTTKINANIMVLDKLRIELLINSEVSNMVSISTSGGSVF